HIRRQPGKNGLVETRQVELGIVLVRPEKFAGVRESGEQVRATTGGFKWLLLRFQLQLRLHLGTSGSATSSGRLSSRRARTAGWRSLPSAVHSWNATWATRRGARRVIPFSLGGSARAVSFFARDRNRLCNALKVF